MKRKWIKYTFLLLGLGINIPYIYSQVTMTVSFRYSGSCRSQVEVRQLEAQINAMIPKMTFSTRAECNQVASQLNSISVGDSYCRVTVSCNCTGSDIPLSTTQQSNPGTINFSGVNQGQPFFTPNPTTEVEDWSTTNRLRNEALAPGSNQNNFATAKTGNLDADNQYLNLANNINFEGFSTIPIYRNGELWMAHDPSSHPKLPGLDEKIILLPPPSPNKSEIDYWNSEKNKLISEKEELLKKCFPICPHSVDDRLQEIDKEMYALNNRIKGKEEWLNEIQNMPKGILDEQEINTAMIVEMAGLAGCSYADKQDMKPEVWDYIDKANIIADGNNNKEGFHCELLYNETEDKYVLSFRGTDDINDMMGAWLQGNFTNANAQTQMALNVTGKLLEAGIPPEKLQLTGHSLGGRLAAEAAIEYDLIAYTFNAADVSLETRNGNKINNSGNILNTISANDVLSSSTFGLGNTKGGINYNWSSNLVDTKSVSTTKNVVNTVKNVATEAIGIRTGTYSPGQTNVVKEAYGNTSFDAHDMRFLNQSLEQRHNDIVTEQEKRKK